jgi:hypothetical protein
MSTLSRNIRRKKSKRRIEGSRLSKCNGRKWITKEDQKKVKRWSRKIKMKKTRISKRNVKRIG